MVKKIAEKIIRFRIIIGVIILLGTVFFAYQIKNVRLYYDAGNISPIGHPYTKLHSKMIDVFGVANLVAIAMIVKDGDVL
jgi:predicted RND superfamily exporter protein